MSGSRTRARTHSRALSTTESGLPPLIVIAGATATGKTALSLELANLIPGAEIISADSRQVYRDMDIGTAKVTAEQRSLVPHHALDLVDPDEPFSAADYRRAALDALHSIAARGGVALLVGGTGLYLRTVARGVALDETGSDSAIRAELESRLERDGLDALVVELRSIAPAVAAATDLANPRRVVRALERAMVLGDVLPEPPLGYAAPSVWIGLKLDQAAQAWRIEDRVRAQFASGLLDEARELRLRYDPGLRSFSAVGYHEAFAVLDGSFSTDEAIQRTAARTRQVARRQRTWFRAEPDINWLDAARHTTDDLTPATLRLLRSTLPELAI